MFWTKKPKTFDKNSLPRHVAIIMDGNGRWARRRALPRQAGHRAGAEALRRICRYAGKIGIRYITVYAFSTENWKRSDSEVSSLMELLLYYLKNAEKELGGDDARICVIGDRSCFSEEIQREMARVEEVTKNNGPLTVTLALNYGGRSEIVRAVKGLVKDINAGKQSIDGIDEDTFSSYLDTHILPEPDLIIRTSGEMRLSNFLLWQSAYSEFYFCDTLWPDFDEKAFDRALIAYHRRDRRFGGR